MHRISRRGSYYQNFQTDPGFQASLNAGTSAIEQSASGKGNFRSGGTLAGLFDYGQRNLQDAFNSRLASLAGVGAQGQTAATNMGNWTQSGGRDIAGYLSDTGNANATGTINAGNANMAGITGAADWQTGGILGAANANIGGMLGATNQRIGGMQNLSWLNNYGAGQMASGISDLAGRFSGPLSQYAGNAFSGMHAPTSGLIF